MVVRGTVQETDCPPRVSCRIMSMNLQNQSISYFCGTHLRVHAEGYTAQRNSVKYVAKNAMYLVHGIVMQVDFVENLPLKLIAHKSI